MNEQELKVWEEMDSNFNTEELFEREVVPDGQYVVSIDSANLKQSKTGLPMVSIAFKIIDSAEKWGNRLVFYNQVITNNKELNRVSMIIKNILKPYNMDFKFESFVKLGEFLSRLVPITKDRNYLLSLSTTKRGFRIYKVEM